MPDPLRGGEPWKPAPSPSAEPGEWSLGVFATCCLGSNQCSRGRNLGKRRIFLSKELWGDVSNMPRQQGHLPQISATSQGKEATAGLDPTCGARCCQGWRARLKTGTRDQEHPRILVGGSVMQRSGVSLFSSWHFRDSLIWTQPWGRGQACIDQIIVTAAKRGLQTEIKLSYRKISLFVTHLNM